MVSLFTSNPSEGAIRAQKISSSQMASRLAKALPPAWAIGELRCAAWIQRRLKRAGEPYYKLRKVPKTTLAKRVKELKVRKAAEGHPDADDDDDSDG